MNSIKGKNMESKKDVFLVYLVLFGWVFIYSSTTFAKVKNGNNENTDMNLEEFNQKDCTFRLLT